MTKRMNINPCHFLFYTHCIKYCNPKKSTLFSGNAGEEKNLHLGSRKFIFHNRFSWDILFSSLISFAFFVFLFFGLFVCFLKLKTCILIHIRLCGRVSDEKNFTRPSSGNKTTFLCLILPNFLVWKFCENTIATLRKLFPQNSYTRKLGEISLYYALP